jgi:hypothetical protein
MTSSVETAWLPDVNFWLALVSDGHEHHTLASQWFSRGQTRSSSAVSHKWGCYVLGLSQLLDRCLPGRFRGKSWTQYG